MEFLKAFPIATIDEITRASMRQGRSFQQRILLARFCRGRGGRPETVAEIRTYR